MSTLGGYHEYIGGCSVHRGVFSTSRGYHEYIGGYHEYIGGCSVHQRDIMMHVGDTTSTSWDVQYIGFSIEIERFSPTCSPTCIMISPRCTEHPPMYSWYPPMY